VDPREEKDNLGIMLCWHRRYDLGDGGSWDGPAGKMDIEKGRGIIGKAAVVLPLYLMGHGGLAMNTYGFGMCDPQGWDWGKVGWIYTTKERIREWFGIKRVIEKYLKKAREILEAEVREYDRCRAQRRALRRDRRRTPRVRRSGCARVGQPRPQERGRRDRPPRPRSLPPLSQNPRRISPFVPFCPLLVRPAGGNTLGGPLVFPLAF